MVPINVMKDKDSKPMVYTSLIIMLTIIDCGLFNLFFFVIILQGFIIFF